MIRKPETVSDFEGVNKVLQDFFNNLGVDDLRPSGIREGVPGSEEVNKGRFVITEVSGVPRLYIRGTNGTLYLMSTGTPV